MKYDVYAKETVYYKIPVEARSKQEAIDKIITGNYEIDTMNVFICDSDNFEITKVTKNT